MGAVEGVEVTVGADGVIVVSRDALTVLSSAVAGGGVAVARTIVNARVPKNYPWAAGDAAVADFVRRRALPVPFVGLLTSARTDRAEVAVETAGGVTALVVATVGLSNTVAAGHSAAARAAPGTINTIVIVDADPEPGALVNVVITVTEVKARVLGAAGVRCADGQPASGTSTDAVVVAATGRGSRCQFGGPISALGWVVARATHAALHAGVTRWLEAHR